MARNYIGLYNLFGDNNESKKAFLEWCKDNDELCEYDIERIAIDLYAPVVDNSDRYFHFHKGNILDWLESCGYYIGLPLRGRFKYVTVVHFNSQGNVNQKPLYSNSGVKDRNRALELGVIRAIEAYDKQLNQINNQF